MKNVFKKYFFVNNIKCLPMYEKIKIKYCTNLFRTNLTMIHFIRLYQQYLYYYFFKTIVIYAEYSIKHTLLFYF